MVALSIRSQGILKAKESISGNTTSFSVSLSKDLVALDLLIEGEIPYKDFQPQIRKSYTRHLEDHQIRRESDQVFKSFFGLKNRSPLKAPATFKKLEDFIANIYYASKRSYLESIIMEGIKLSLDED